MNCKNCKHFRRISVFQGSCINNNFKTGYVPKFTGYDTDDCYDNVHPNQILIEDDEGWGFRVGEDFGCIHFETGDKLPLT